MAEVHGKSLVGKKNAYICKDCGKPTVTIDRDVSIGWKQSDLDALERIFWRFKDHNGRLKSQN